MGSQATASLLASSVNEAPLIAQLFGANIFHIEEAVRLLRRQGWLYFDLNLGCPARKVIRQGAGSALLASREECLKIVSAMIKTARLDREDYPQSPHKPMIGFKIRSGFETGKSVLPDLALRIEDAGADWLALHPRYGKQGFTGQANHEEIYSVAQRLSIPLVASGDLFDAETGIACLEATGASGVMYARGALKNPVIFREHCSALQGLSGNQHNTVGLTEVIRTHIHYARAYCRSERDFRKLRSMLPRYARHSRGVGQLRQNLAHCNDWNCLIEEIERFTEFSRQEKEF